MKVRIHYEIKDSEGDIIEDSFILEGDTVEEIREQASTEIARRGATNPWSEEL